MEFLDIYIYRRESSEKGDLQVLKMEQNIVYDDE